MYSYYIQTFSNDVEALPFTEIGRINPDGSPGKSKILSEGVFKAVDYNTAVNMAAEAGYTKILSIENGVRHILWAFGYRYVVIRCVKETETESVNPEVVEVPEPDDAD